MVTLFTYTDNTVGLNKMRQLTSLFCILCAVVTCKGRTVLQTCGFESCNPVKEGMVNVHLVPHTHDDVGWLKTVDEYYYGARLDIQRAGVCYILDSVIPQLLENPARRFIYVEIAFFWRWWEEQTEAMKSNVRMLVDEGRLEFTLGGWAMNDEGTTHYSAIIDQHTLGLRWLNETFGKCAHPRVAWQIDPFGHSRQQASLFAQIGYDALYFGRIDYQDKTTRLTDNTMEMVWRGSPRNLGDKADLFTGTLYNGYSPPPGFCYDISCLDPVWMDDERMHDVNIEERVKAFVEAVNDQAKHYTTNHIMMTMGSDFMYSNAHSWYLNLDKLIKYVNNEQLMTNVNVLYSTPSCYTYYVNKAQKTYTTKEDDFFPYAIKPHGFLTGFFTSRPALKGFARDSNAWLQGTRQLHVLANLQDYDGSFNKIFQLEEASGIVQHHDAITGTEKQRVSDDYTDRLGRAWIATGDVINAALSRLLPHATTLQRSSIHYTGLLKPVCIPTGSETIQIILWNPLARAVRQYVKVYVFGSHWNIWGADNGRLELDVCAAVGETEREIITAVSLPALGFTVLNVNTSADSTKENIVSWKKLTEDKVVGNKRVGLLFDGTTGRLKRMYNHEKHLNISLQQKFQYYLAYQGDNHGDTHQSSGAYIFRPNTSTTERFPSQEFHTSYREGKVVQEVLQVFSPWVSQVIRIYEDQPYVEVEWTVGPIPIEDGQGKEVINLFKTDLHNNQQFFTDANGREILSRKLNHRDTWKFNQTEPVAGNYFPVNTRMYIKDEERDIQFTVLTDRSEGGSSLREGEVELMVHRRLLKDDALGVGEALNETGADGRGLVVTGKHYLLLDTISDAPVGHRLLAEEILMRPVETVIQGHVFPPVNKSLLKRELPKNVHLLTLQQIPDDQKGSSSFLILRLEHQFEVDEDPVLSKPVTVDLNNLVTPFDIISMEELTLGANMALKDLHRLNWKTQFTATEKSSKVTQDDTNVVTLDPMDIKTFKVEVTYKTHM